MLNSRAYTLLEVTVALIIVGISITAVTGALSTAKGLSARADHAIEGLRILKNILNNPKLIHDISENEIFDNELEGEDGWKCHGESTPLIVNSADLLVTAGEDADSQEKGSDSGEEIEVPGMLSVKICVSDEKEFSSKQYCIIRWVQEP